ncbi:MAG: hypothetical protein KDB60_19220, partial [Propionibacteriaceae bacterium]|nr:hypothetical protein [Propionibacteriaceae bacterium]
MATVLALAAGSLITSAPPASAADDCASLTAPVYRTIRPSIGAQLLTRWKSEATGSTANYGFTDVRGTLGYGSSSQKSGYVAVTRMYSPKAYDFMWVTSDAEKAKAVAAGYVTQMVNFYAPSTAASCTVAVHRYVKGTHVRNAWTAAEDSSLRAAGWTDAGTSFYLKPGSSEAAIATASASASASATPTVKATTATPTP